MLFSDQPQVLDNGDVDPNLQIQQQRADANPAADATGVIPPPPPLPAPTSRISPTTATPNDATPLSSIPAPPALVSNPNPSVNDAAPMSPDPTLATPTPASPVSPTSQPTSQIFAGDPTRPGSGYTTYNGQQYRIAGTTAAGLGANGQPKPVTATDQYLLDDGKGGTITGGNINVADYNAWVNQDHGANTYTPAEQAINNQPLSTTPHYLQNGLDADASGNAVPGGYNALTDLYRQLGTTPGTVNQRVLDLVKQNPALVSTLPPDQAQTLTRTLQSMGVTVPQMAAPLSSSATAGATPSAPTGGIGTNVPLGGPASGLPEVPAYTGTPGRSLSATAGAGTGSGPYTPGNVAIGSTILPNADPRLSNLQSLLDSSASSLGSVDRAKLANDIFSQVYDASNPQYLQDLRHAKQAAYGSGMGGSAGERDLYRNTFTTRQAQLDNAKRGIINDAVSGSIADQFNKVGALSGLEGQAYSQGANDRSELRGERGYQGSLEQQAFDRALTQYQQQQKDVADRFSRGVTLTQLGSQGNPSDYLLQLASQYGVDPSVIAALAAQQGQRSIPAPPAH